MRASTSVARAAVTLAIRCIPATKTCPGPGGFATDDAALPYREDLCHSPVVQGREYQSNRMITGWPASTYT